MSTSMKSSVPQIAITRLREGTADDTDLKSLSQFKFACNVKLSGRKDVHIRSNILTAGVSMELSARGDFPPKLL